MRGAGRPCRSASQQHFHTPATNNSWRRHRHASRRAMRLWRGHPEATAACLGLARLQRKRVQAAPCPSTAVLGAPTPRRALGANVSCSARCSAGRPERTQHVQRNDQDGRRPAPAAYHASRLTFDSRAHPHQRTEVTFVTRLHFLLQHDTGQLPSFVSTRAVMSIARNL